MAARSRASTASANGPEVGEIAKAVVAAAPRLQGALGWEVTEGEAAAKLARLRPVLDPDLAVVGEEDVAVAVPDMTPVRRAVVRGAGPVETARLAAGVRRAKAGAVVAFLTEPALLGALEARAAAGGYRRLGTEDETSRLLWERHL